MEFVKLTNTTSLSKIPATLHTYRDSSVYIDNYKGEEAGYVDITQRMQKEVKT